MKCLSDAANCCIIKVSNEFAEMLVHDKPLRYSYTSKKAFKSERDFEAANKSVTQRVQREVGKKSRNSGNKRVRRGQG